MAISDPLQAMNCHEWICSPEGIPASLSARPESEAENKTRGIFGPSSRDSFAYFDPDMCCWRTSQGTFLSGLDQFSETWPDSGTMRNGCVYGLQISERPTCESACSSWRTPIERDHHPNKLEGRTSELDATIQLAHQAERWPTARSEDGESCGNHPGATDSLTGATRHWNTPHGMSNRDSSGKVGGCGGGEVGKQANQWVTPQAHQGGANSKREERGSGGPDLKEQSERWQTPATDSFRSRGGDRSDEMGLDQQARSHLDPQIPAGQPSSESVPTSRRRLNPQFVEWLMGFPIHWTEL